MEYFITNNFKSEIKNLVLDIVFEKLNSMDKNILLDYLVGIMDLIAIKFNFDLDNRSKFEYQFRQNNYRDTIGLLFMLLPYIPDNLKPNLKSFEDLFTAKYNKGDINKQEPKYIYSNIQYGRCLRDNNNPREIKFNYNFLKTNYILLADTINIIANKLYINFINIRPVSKKNIYNKPYYIQTNNYLISRKIPDYNIYEAIINNNSENKFYSGIPAGEIYNILTNYLYFEIKNIKWIIYEISDQNILYKFPILLNKYINIEPCAKNIPWNILSPEIKINLLANWSNLLFKFQKNSDKIISRIIFELIQFFDKKYKLSDLEYTRLNLNSDLESDLDNQEELSNITTDLISKFYITGKSLDFGDLYEYIRDSLFLLRNTWYSRFYLKFDPNIQNYILNKNPESYYDKSKIITIKNIYNFSKSLCHYQDNKKYLIFPRFWKSLEDSDKKIILARINYNYLDNKITWFNIMGYLTRLGLSQNSAIKLNIKIHNNIQKNLADILFDILIRNGIYSEFIPDFGLSDQKNLPENPNIRNQYIISQLNIIKSQFDNSYYYLNGLKYKYNQNLIGPWINTYAMDWISQINFFHRYLNNRIIYITGATGTGKSTQIPKLVLYALKTLDYKLNGKIAMSQPRITPTRINTQTIASQLGVPIYYHNKSINSELITNNYYIQFKYKSDSHESNINSNYLTIMTDGILYQKLKNILFKTNNNYSARNIYDIIMVDEAHEHNKNMDLILTKLKYSTYFNNNIKLLILSATMEADEPIYRRYFRDINDNRIYPFNLNLSKYNLDRINIDRRINISAPGQTTLFEITDIYKPDSEINNLVLEIIKSGPGDILIFQPGRGEISDIISELNNITPPDTIAVPFYSELPVSKREFIENISKLKSELLIPKYIPFDSDYNLDNIRTELVPAGTYKRVIIISTNIAEASITIDSLKYIIETGKQKINIFNYKTRTSQLILTDISESSRIQRRGRVGRTQPGTVYYLYPENSMVNNKKIYDIFISDLTDIFFDLLYSDPSEKKLFEQDPNQANFNPDYKFESGISEIIKTQYFIKNKFVDYLGNKSEYDYQNNKIYNYYQTGFDKNTISDPAGEFYIINPEELNLTRNITGKIISVNPESELIFQNNNFISPKLEIFFQILSERLFIIYNQPEILYKTELGINTYEISRKINIDDIKFLISYLYSLAYNIPDNMLKLIACLSEIRSTRDLFADEYLKSRYIIKFDKPLKIYSNKYGDYHGLINILDQIINLFDNNKFQFNNFSQILNQKKLFIKNYKTKNFRDMDPNIINKFLKLFYNNKLNFDLELSSSEKRELILNNLNIQEYLNQINLNLIQKFAELNSLKYNKLLDIFKNYLELKNNIYKYQQDILDLDPDIPNKYINLSWFKSHIYKITNLNLDPILISIINGYNFNLVKKILITPQEKYYLNLWNPSLEFVYKIGKIYKSKTAPDNTLLEKLYQGDLLFLSNHEDEIFLIQNININLIPEILPVITYLNLINNKYYNLDYQKKYISEFITKLSLNKNQNIDSKIISKYISTINSIKSDLLNNFDPIYINKLKIIDDRPNIKKIIKNNIKLIQNQIGGYNINNINKINSDFIKYMIKILNKNNI